MNDLYAFVIQIKGLDQVDEDRKKLLKDMLLQTTECTYFIRDKTQVENFCKLHRSMAIMRY